MPGQYVGGGRPHARSLSGWSSGVCPSDLVAALLGAMKEATAWIKSDRRAAAEAYLRVTKDKMPVNEFLAMLNDPNIVITIVPKGADKISELLAKVGRIKSKPDNWKDYYFGDLDKLQD